MKTKRMLILMILAAVARCGVATAASQYEGWQERKGKHFIIYYQADRDEEVVTRVMRLAEDYYRKIGRTIGFVRYGDFWTWDDRAKIFIFPDQESFVKTTGQPLWSTGYAARDNYTFQSRTIVTYRQEDEFYEGLLPHEIAHLILHDYLSEVRIPIWFDEGIAQMYEKSKSEQADRIMRAMIRQGQYIDLPTLMRLDIRQSNNTDDVVVFYSQSLSVIEFLIKTYGEESFTRLCRGLRDGKTFEKALRRAYTVQIPDLSTLEEKWVRSLQQ